MALLQYTGLPNSPPASPGGYVSLGVWGGEEKEAKGERRVKLRGNEDVD